MTLARLILLFLLAALPLHAEEVPAGSELPELLAEVTLQFEQRIAEIRALRSTVMRLRAEFEGLDSLPARVYSTRMDAVLARMFSQSGWRISPPAY